ncbi:hypothetical protein MASR2M117_00220 [Paludibacter sp.]
MSLPPTELKIDPKKSSDYLDHIPLYVNHLNYGLMLTSVDFELQYQNILNDFYKISAFAWHQLTHGSLVNRMKSAYGKDWTTDYWTTFKDNTCSQQQYGLAVGWATYRENVLLNQFFGTISSYYLNNSENMRRRISIIQDYITMFRDLRAINCSYQSIEKALCSKSVLQFRDNLIALYPSLNYQIRSIVQKVSGNITFMTYNLYRDLPSNSQYSRIPDFARVISCCNADVIAIQEVRDISNLSKLKEETGFDGARYNTMLFYGIGMLWNPALGTPKITTKEINPLSSSTDNEIRAYMIAEFEDFYFIATHFSLDKNEQNRMAAEIIAYAKTVNKPVYVGGDFNATANDPSIMNFTGNNFIILNDQTQFTFPVSNPEKQLDMILGFKRISKQHTVISRGIPVFPSEDLRNLSDHLPYYVTINMNELTQEY